MSFANRLKALREAKNVSQSTLAKQIGVSRSTICNYENGHREKPSVPVICAIAEVLGVSPEELTPDLQLVPRQLDPNNPEDNEAWIFSLLLDETFLKIAEAYKRINDDGGKRLLQYAEELLQIERYEMNKYTKPDGSIGVKS